MILTVYHPVLAPFAQNNRMYLQVRVISQCLMTKGKSDIDNRPVAVKYTPFLPIVSILQAINKTIGTAATVSKTEHWYSEFEKHWDEIEILSPKDIPSWLIFLSLLWHSSSELSVWSEVIVFPEFTIPARNHEVKTTMGIDSLPDPSTRSYTIHIDLQDKDDVKCALPGLAISTASRVPPFPFK